MVTIAIVDNEERRKAFAANFRAVGCKVLEFDSDTDITSHSVDVLCIHYRDDKEDVNKISRSLAVYYGGRGEPDDAWLTRKDTRPNSHRIWRPIPSATEALTQNESLELVEYVSAISDKNRGNALPSFLQPPRDVSTLIALSILCQGYIAACDPENFHLKRRLELLAEKVTAEDQFGRAGWWLNVLLKDAKTNSPEDVAASVAELKVCVNQQWSWSNVSSDTKPVFRLLDSIKYDSTPTEMVVKGALLSICQFLNQQQT